MNIENEVEQGIEHLKRICESPSKYITNYINEIKDSVNYEFERLKARDETILKSEEKLNELNRVYNEFMNKISEFEYECWFSNKLETSLIKQTLEKIESIESIFKINPYDGLDELYDLIEIELYNVLSNIFHNKTLIFVHNDAFNTFKLLKITNEFIGLKLIDILMKK